MVAVPAALVPVNLLKGIPNMNFALAPALLALVFSSPAAVVGMMFISAWAFVAIKSALSQIASMESPPNVQPVQPMVLQLTTAWPCRKAMNKSKTLNRMSCILSAAGWQEMLM